MSKFKVGDKVTPVLIDGEVHNYLDFGAVYTVTGVDGEIIDIYGVPSKYYLSLNADGGIPWGVNWSDEWFKLADEQILGNAFEKAVESVGANVVANSLIEKENKEMTAEQIRDEILRIDARIEEAKKDIENAENERNSLVEKLREKGFELVKDVETAYQPADITSLDDVVVGETYVVTNKYGKAEDHFVGKKVIVKAIDYDANELFVYVGTENGVTDWVHYKDLARI